MALASVHPTEMPKKMDRVAHNSTDTPGSNATIGRLFAEHNASLIRFLRVRLNSDQDAREVAQEAYMRLLQLDKPNAVSFPRSYLFRVAANIATDRLRHQAVRRMFHADLLFDATDNLCPERYSAAREQVAIVELSLSELPQRVREAFLMQRLNGFSAAEVARRLGLNERTTCHYISKAMLHCRRRLDEALDEPSGLEVTLR
jgi:RNA polymerase sigma factor (sigma-70 family)